MNRKLFFVLLLGLIVGCGSNDKPADASEASEAPKSMLADPSSYDPHRGEGKHSTVEISPTLDVAAAEAGAKIQSVKCASCHKLSGEKLVGPGWKGVTERRTPVWLMNFITNPDPMINKDPALQAQLELCLVRMPNQGLTDDEARQILEFMRKNDGVK